MLSEKQPALNRDEFLLKPSAQDNRSPSKMDKDSDFGNHFSRRSPNMGRTNVDAMTKAEFSDAPSS